MVQTGVQLLTGFLLTLPFQQRFDVLDTTMRVVYLITVGSLGRRHGAVGSSSRDASLVVSSASHPVLGLRSASVRLRRAIADGLGSYRRKP